MKGYFKYVTRKMGWYLLTLFVAVLLNFVLPRLMPGDPVTAMIALVTEGLTDAQAAKQIYEAYMVEFGLDKPIWQQFIIYVGNLFQGKLGLSFSQYPRPVASMIAGAVPWTLRLQIPAIITGWCLGNALGAIAAYRRGILDKTIFPISFSCPPSPPLRLPLLMFLSSQ